MSTMTRHEFGQVVAWLIVLTLIIYSLATEVFGVGTPPSPWTE